MQKKLNPTLYDVYDTYKKWLYVEDTKRIDLLLAVALTRKCVNSPPLWMVVVSKSGDWKSEQINALYDPEIAVKLDRLTSRTLVSGNKKSEDLAPKLTDKLVLFSDFASMLKAHPQEKAEIFAQMRELYDGRAGGAFGTGKHKHYEGIRTTWIIGSTPAIDRQILIHQDLGTRELIFRPIITNEQLAKIKGRIMENRWNLMEMREEMRAVTTRFIKKTEFKIIKDILPEVQESLFNIVDYVCVMRASAACDSYTGELLGNVDMEMPTRVLQQLLLLYEALKSLRPDYPDELAIGIIREVAFSSCNPVRMAVFNYLVTLGQGFEDTTHHLADELKVGRKTVFSELNALWNLGVLNMERVQSETHLWKDVQKWSVNYSHHLTKSLLEVDKSLLISEYLLKT